VEQAVSYLLRNHVLCPAEFCGESGSGGRVADEHELASFTSMSSVRRVARGPPLPSSWDDPGDE